MRPDKAPPPRSDPAKEIRAQDLYAMQGVRGVIGDWAFQFEVGELNKNKKHKVVGEQGTEGLVTWIQIDGVRHALKLFLQPSDERTRRIKFLTGLKLHESRCEVFEAAPFAFVRGTLNIVKERREVAVEGYIAKYIEGRTLDELCDGNIDQWDAVSESQRLKMAAELCLAVRILESAKLAHGDLQPKNLIICKKSLGMRLIDFDGYFYPDASQVPLIPLHSRPVFGCDGYRHRVSRPAEGSQAISSDRTALAILVYSIVVLRASHGVDKNVLPLIEQAALDRGQVAVVPEIARAWPAGFELLEAAVKAPTAAGAPSPDAWLHALRSRNVPIIVPLGDRHAATLSIRCKQNPPLKSTWTVPERETSMAEISPDLSWLRCRMTTNGMVWFIGNFPPKPAAQMLFHTRMRGENEHRDLLKGRPITFEAHVGDLIFWNSYEIQITRM